MTSEEFCTRMIQEEHVAVVPGSAFGASGEGFIRISYSYSLKHITEALDRMERFIAKNKR
jgi:aminotransferase